MTSPAMWRSHVGGLENVGLKKVFAERLFARGLAPVENNE